MNERTDKRTNRRTNKQTNERQTDKWTNEQTNERKIFLLMNGNAAKMSACSSNFGPDENLLCTIFFFFAMWKLNEASKTFLLGKNSNYSRVQKWFFLKFFFKVFTQKSENMTVALLRRKNYSLLKWCWLRGKMHYSLIEEKTPKKFFVESGPFDRIQLDQKDI